MINSNKHTWNEVKDYIIINSLKLLEKEIFILWYETFVCLIHSTSSPFLICKKKNIHCFVQNSHITLFTFIYIYFHFVCIKFIPSANFCICIHRDFKSQTIWINSSNVGKRVISSRLELYTLPTFTFLRVFPSPLYWMWNHHP